MSRSRQRAAILALASGALLLLLFFFARQFWVLGLLDGLLTSPSNSHSGAAGRSGKESCPDCHVAVAGLHDRGPHRSLLCGECHGPLERHVVDGEVAGPMARVTGVTRLCSRCHRDLISRRGEAPRLNLEAHVVEVGALFEEDVCFDCHLPHDPRP